MQETQQQGDGDTRAEAQGDGDPQGWSNGVTGEPQGCRGWSNGAMGMQGLEQQGNRHAKDRARR